VGSLSYLVSTCATARQNALDSALAAIRAYRLAIAAVAELSETTASRRQWCEDTANALDDAWRGLDTIRWDHGPASEKP
jgi:hypothetical protein